MSSSDSSRTAQRSDSLKPDGWLDVQREPGRLVRDATPLAHHVGKRLKAHTSVEWQTAHTHQPLLRPLHAVTVPWIVLKRLTGDPVQWPLQVGPAGGDMALKAFGRLRRECSVPVVHRLPYY